MFVKISPQLDKIQVGGSIVEIEELAQTVMHITMLNALVDDQRFYAMGYYLSELARSLENSIPEVGAKREWNIEIEQKRPKGKSRHEKVYAYQAEIDTVVMLLLAMGGPRMMAELKSYYPGIHVYEDISWSGSLTLYAIERARIDMLSALVFDSFREVSVMKNVIDKYYAAYLASRQTYRYVEVDWIENFRAIVRSSSLTKRKKFIGEWIDELIYLDPSVHNKRNVTTLIKKARLINA